jgi:hypothetical protein
MDFFLPEGGSCSYDDETTEDIKVPLSYKHLVKQWVPKDIRCIIMFFYESIYFISILMFSIFLL